MQNMSSELIVEKEANGIVTVTLNRPQQLNALSPTLLKTLAQTFKNLRSDPSVKVVILTGKGRAFCAGIDLNVAKYVHQ